MKIVVNNFSHVWLCLQVACRQLGFTLAVDVRVSSFYGGGEGMVWLDRVGCSGEEVEVMQCNHSDWGIVSEACRNHSSDAGVVCAGEVCGVCR